jgi:Leucine-rich repeat (LRR) protein
MEDYILNDHNKDEFPPAHTKGTNVPLKYWDFFRVFIFTALIFSTGCASQNKLANNDGFCPTFLYEGQLVDSDGTSSNVSISLMTLLDSTLVGSCYYDTLSSVTYSLGGKAKQNKTFEMGEFRNGNLAFIWKGIINDGGKTIEGIRTDINNIQEYRFKASVVFGKSYWDYIRKKESYDSYTDLNDAILHKDKVLRVDFENRGWTSLPAEIAELSKLESVNLLGNNIDSFPPVLAQMKNVFVLSLCSNKMKYIGPEIGEMTNLRVLIINMNHLHSLPKEIGNLKNLMYLDIGENPIDSLPEEIKNLTKLQELHIDNWQSSSERFSDEYKQHLQDLLPNCRIHFDKNDH